MILATDRALPCSLETDQNRRASALENEDRDWRVVIRARPGLRRQADGDSCAMPKSGQQACIPYRVPRAYIGTGDRYYLSAGAAMTSSTSARRASADTPGRQPPGPPGPNDGRHQFHYADRQGHAEQGVFHRLLRTRDVPLSIPAPEPVIAYVNSIRDPLPGMDGRAARP
jgi:hypothetical protein